jgi:hypothetical protein
MSFGTFKEVTMGGLFPVGQSSKGLSWSKEQVDVMIVNEINLEIGFFSRRAKNMSEDFEKATKAINESTAMLDAAMNHLKEKEAALSEHSKKVSGGVRKSANDLFTGMAAIEKMANFDKLERYVLLLERTATALTTLSDLDKAGKLEKIFSVVKN